MSATPRPPIFDHSAELLARAKKEIYKSNGNSELPLFIFRPPDKADKNPLPAVIFFYSSLWDKGLVSQFAPQCIYLSQRGVIAIAADYRVSGRDGTGAIEAMADARDAIRWIRLNADTLNVNPHWVVAAGGSAGAHLALSTAMLDDPPFSLPGEDHSISHRPNAALLYGPLIDPAPLHAVTSAFADLKLARQANLIRHIRTGLPPILIFQGSTDRINPIAPVVEFSRLMKKKKNSCTLYTFDGAGSGFFNFNVDPQNYETVLLASEDFLADLGFLPQPPPHDSDGDFPSIESRLASA